jgi:RNA polymerase sigma factor (sigma-70 family)
LETIMNPPLRTVLGHLQRHACHEYTGALTDTELLRRYLTRRDEAAFESLVWRHGAMVLGVCRRVTRHEQDAEDAFQAVFLTFARAAGAITRGDSVGGWLYRVAGRVARKARARSARLATLPLDEVVQPGMDPADEATRHELRPVLDEEVGRLPGKYREPFVLCYLQGRTNVQAAQELGWPKGTVATRLARARRLLRARLGRRGLALPVAGSAFGAEFPRVSLVMETIQGSLVFANGGSAARRLVSDSVATLTQGALRTMSLRNRLLFAAVLVLTGFIITTTLVTASQFQGDPPSSARPHQTGTPDQTARNKPQVGPNRLLFYRQGHLILIGPDGKDACKVSEDRNKFMPGNARLSPDGKQLAFLVQAEEDPPKNRDPLRKVYVRRLDEPEPGTDLGEAQMLSWSPDSKQLVVTYFVRGVEPKDDTFATVMVDLKTGKRTAVKLPDNQFVTDWSRDGKYFVTTEVSREEETGRLHLVRRDGSEDKVLRAAGNLAIDGRLSPDGSKVLYDGPDPERKGKGRFNESGLFVLDLRTNKVARVQGQALNGSTMGYCWSPDGKHIAHAWRMDCPPPPEGEMTESVLIVSDADGSNPRTIATERGEFPGTITISDPDWR